jgi:WD40 repeat protein
MQYPASRPRKGAATRVRSLVPLVGRLGGGLAFVAPVFRFKPPTMSIFEGHTGPVTCVAFSPDSRYALSGSEDGTVRLWEVATACELRCFRGHEGKVLAVAFFLDRDYSTTTTRQPGPLFWKAGIGINSPPWTVVSAGSDRTIRLWRPSDSTELNQYPLHEQAVFGATFSSDGNRAIFWGSDQPVSQGSPNIIITSIWYGDSGGKMMEGGAGDPWDTLFEEAEQPADPLDVQVHLAAFTSREPLAVVGTRMQNQTYILHEVAVEPPCDETTFLRIHTPEVVGAYSPNGWRLVLSCESADPCGTDRMTLRLFDMRTRNDFPHRFLGHSKVVTCVTFSPEGCRILSGSDDKTVRLWCVRTGRQLCCFQGHIEPVNCVAISSDGRLAISGSRDCTVRIWNLPG